MPDDFAPSKRKFYVFLFDEHPRGGMSDLFLITDRGFTCAQQFAIRKAESFAWPKRIIAQIATENPARDLQIVCVGVLSGNNLSWSWKYYHPMAAELSHRAFVSRDIMLGILRELNGSP